MSKLLKAKKSKKVEDPEYRCCCGRLHVKEISLGLAITRIIIATDIMMVGLSAKVFEYFYKQEIFLPFYFTGIFLFENPLIFCVAFCLIYGFVKEKPLAYLPQLVVDILRIIVGSLAIGSNIFMSITNLLAEKEDENNLKFINKTVRETRQDHKKTELFVDDTLLKEYITGSQNVPFILCVIFLIFTWIVTFRTYQYMREVNAKKAKLRRPVGSASTNDDVFI